GERLRRDELPELALRREALVVVEAVRVVLRLHEAADVVLVDRLLELRAADRPPDPAVHVARVEREQLDVRLRLRHVGSFGSRTSTGPFAITVSSCVFMTTSTVTSASPEVGSSPTLATVPSRYV